MDRTLRAFLAVAEAGNLTNAAARLGLTQPAVTKTIHKLEEEYGARLFERSARGMTLTQVGARLLTRARAIEMHYRQVDEEMKALRGGGVAELRIVAGAAYNLTIAPDLVRQLAQEYPLTRFSIDFDVGSVAVPRLVAGEADLVLGALSELPTEGVESCELMDVEMVPYCSSEHPLARAVEVSPADLADSAWVIYKRDSLSAERLARYFATHRVAPPRIAMEVDALAATFRVLRGSPFLTLAPASVAPGHEILGRHAPEAEAPALAIRVRRRIPLIVARYSDHASRHRAPARSRRPRRPGSITIGNGFPPLFHFSGDECRPIDALFMNTPQSVTMPATIKINLSRVLKHLIDLRHNLTSGYKPELHYMRGPGPAFLRKHSA